MVACGGIQACLARGRQDGPGPAAILRVSLPDQEAVRFQALDQAGEAGGAHEGAAGEDGHAQATAGSAAEAEQDLEIAEGEAVVALEVLVQAGHQSGMGADKGAKGEGAGGGGDAWPAAS